MVPYNIQSTQCTQRKTCKRFFFKRSNFISITDEAERKFYENQAINESLSVRELDRQINSALFERLALSKDKMAVLQLSQKGNIISHPHEAVKDPYILDFLKIPQSHRMTEKHLEQKIIDNLQEFLLELGKGFAFVARQFKSRIFLCYRFKKVAIKK